MEMKIFNHKKYYVVSYHNTKRQADESAKRIRKYGTELVRVTDYIRHYGNGGSDKIYAVWAHTK
jgi:hypothetical protein